MFTNKSTWQVDNIHGGPKKWGHKLMVIIRSNLHNKFTTFLHWKILGKYAVKWLLTIPLLLAYVATLPRETFNVRKQTINDLDYIYKDVYKA